MTVNSQPGANSHGGEILRWPGRVVSADELRRSLNGHRELLLPERAVITPSAAELLDAAGIRVTRESAEARPPSSGHWGLAQERTLANVSSAVGSLEREGVRFTSLPGPGSSSPCAWAQTVAERVSRGECKAAVLFCDDGGLMCCVANKLPGLRAVVGASTLDAGRASATLGANLVAVSPTGRTFFELRQILRIVCQAGSPACPADVARALQELDGHAHC